MQYVFYFLSKNIEFSRALEAARTEYYININGRNYSAELLRTKNNNFNLSMDVDELRYQIKNKTFKLTPQMKEFFDIGDEDIDEISEEIKRLQEKLKEKEKEYVQN